MTESRRTFKDYVADLMPATTADAETAEFRLVTVGQPHRYVQILELLEDALVVQRVRFPLGPELVHFATISSLQPGRMTEEDERAGS